MRTTLVINCFLAMTSTFIATACGADELPGNSNDRFTQASNRIFQHFDRQHEQTWKGPFFFMQLADTQYGMFTGNQGLAQEIALVTRAVQHINRLRPRFVIVCGDLVNANPGNARYLDQVQQYKRDFSRIDADIPLVCVCGNHDIGGRPDADSIASYVKHFGDDYFSFWVGGVYNLVLNSTVIYDPTDAPEVLDAQQAWLDHELAEAQIARAKHIFLFQHHPMFLKEEDEPDMYFNMPLVRRAPLLEQLRQAKVRAIFAGHYHRNSFGRAGEMDMITTGPVGRPLGKDPSGLRIVRVHETFIQHQYYSMDDMPMSIDLTESSAP